MKIYTKRGDQGDTDLFGGQRVKKSHIRVKAYGAIDAASSAIGIAYSSPGLSPRIKTELYYMMNLLFSAGSEIATAETNSAQALLEKHLKNRINRSHTEALEQMIDTFEAELAPLKNFILPAGSDASARLHFARTMVRQAEIGLLELAEKEMVRPEIIQFFNRLSDSIFVLARAANKEQECPDVLWMGAS